MGFGDAAIAAGADEVLVLTFGAEVFVSQTFTTKASLQQAVLGTGQFGVLPLGKGLSGDGYPRIGRMLPPVSFRSCCFSS